MPIKPENKALYPKDWPEISRRIKERAKNMCEFCGVSNYSVGYWIDGKFLTVAEILEALNKDGIDLCLSVPLEQKPIKIILTVAHLDHTPQNCEDENLKALCQRCHNRYDRKHRNQTRRNTKMKGQLNLNI